MNLSPSITGPSPGPAESPQLDIVRTLSPVVRAMGLTRIARGALLGFALGALAGAGVLVAAHLQPFGFSVQLALLALALGVLAGVAWGLLRWPRAPEAARTADLYFGLDDRLTTALELRSSDAPVARVQSRDAAQHIAGLPLGRSRGRWLQRREAGLALLAALAFAGSLALGPPGRIHHPSSAVAAAANTQRIRHATASQIQKLRSQLRLGLTPGQQQSKALQKLDRALARLHRQLLKSSTTRASLRAISATQQQLHQLATALHPINAKAVAQLNGSLAHYLGKRSNSSKNRRSARSALATAQALSRLARSLAHLTPAQRAALARALAKAANATASNSLRSSLRQAASALANSNPRAASAALQQAARSLSQSVGTQAAQSRANAAAAQLGALKNQLAGSAANARQLAALPGSSRSQTGASGKSTQSAQSQGKGSAAGTGQNKGNGRGLQPGQGRGTGARRGAQAGRGNGRGQGRGARNGRGATSRSGKGASGARGAGGRGRSGLTHQGRNVTVYIPGKQGKGPEIIRNGPSGAPQPGALVPYQQVLGQYAHGAHQALDRTTLPPSVQAYVRRYFSTISH